MINLGFLFRYLRRTFSAKERQKPGLESHPPSQRTDVSSAKSQWTTHTASLPRNPYFVQIGLDFGTMFSKCICRDVMTDKAWIHLPSRSDDLQFPFLIPSAILFMNQQLEHPRDPACHYPKNGLHHLKLALEKVALHQWHDPLLIAYRQAFPVSRADEVAAFVTSCAVYLLAGILGEVMNEVRRRFPNFGLNQQDYAAVNMAIPVANAERLEINNLFHKVLREAWSLSGKLAGHPQIHLAELEALRKHYQAHDAGFEDNTCFIYPEVSANVQGFVRSRTAQEGIYLFCDTGAGTVDQSIFIFTRVYQRDLLAYLHGSVLPMGSSYIECRAAGGFNAIDTQLLETLRIQKEREESSPALTQARDWIAQELTQGTETTLALASRKLYVKDQLRQLSIIFGGGGHCEYPYKVAVMRAFSGRLFSSRIAPNVIGIPVPTDLNEPFENAWLKRLSVAYGLAFQKQELSPFMYPQDISTPSPQQIWQPRASLVHAPSKDEC